MARKGEFRHVPEGRGGNFEQDPKVGNASVDRKVRYHRVRVPHFDPGGIPTINRMPAEVQQEAKSHNLTEPPGASQFQRPARSQLYHKVYKPQRSFAKG